MNGISVQHAALDNAASDLMQTAKRIQQRLDTLEGELQPLRAEWTGQAEQAYVAAKARWDQAIQEMIALLAETGTAVSASNSAYRAADQRGAARF